MGQIVKLRTYSFGVAQGIVNNQIQIPYFMFFTIF